MNLLSTLYSDSGKYKLHLHELIHALAENETKKYKQLSIMAEPDRARVATTVVFQGPKRRMDLVYHVSSDDTDTAEEVVLECQGYLTRMQMPPITSRNQLPTKPHLAQQSVTIAGMGCDSFAVFSKAINAITTVFERHVTAAKTVTGLDVSSTGTLSFSNRYFTQHDEVDDLTPIPFSQQIDPLGFLASVAEGIHTADNNVQYFEKIDGSNKILYRKIGPEDIYPGLLVQIQCSFSAVPIGLKRYRVIAKLRSICILDRIVEKVSWW
ncbi:hypothetical protein QCA50_019709 [Cerrena zonata]|uniref:Uncharacterized protein n=1 Tax=Cerrena zonata TaxID=2478898 RepID=A0AAW0F943_9APHY